MITMNRLEAMRVFVRMVESTFSVAARQLRAGQILSGY
jgi:hypothetical protein